MSTCYECRGKVMMKTSLLARYCQACEEWLCSEKCEQDHNRREHQLEGQTT